MTTATPESATALLTYAFETTPHPLTASPATGELALARLRLLISNPLPDPVRCDRITIVLPVGTNAADLAQTGVGIVATATPHTWSVVAVQEDVLVAVPQNGTAEFTRSEHGRDDQVTESLMIELNGVKVSRKEGTARVRVIESSGADPDAPLTERFGESRIEKARYARRDLLAAREAGTEEEGTSTANLSARLRTGAGEPDGRPATLVPGTTPVVLTWQGPPGTHTLYSTPHPDGIPITFPYETFPLERDETFVVKTDMGGVERYDSVTVAVSTPVLPGLHVGSVVGAPALALDAASVTCTGTLDAAALIKAEKTCTVDLAVTVTGSATTSTLTSSGAVIASGADPKLTAGRLSVTGTLQSDDTLNANRGPVRILGEPVVETVVAVRKKAKTDGFLVGSVQGGHVKLDAQGTKAHDCGKDWIEGTSSYGGHGTAALPVHRDDNYVGENEESYDGKAQYVFYPIGHA